MWTEWITFTAYGVPEAKPRARAASIGSTVRLYQPKTPKDWAAALRATAREFRPDSPTILPVRVDVVWFLPRPKAHYRTGKHAGELKVGVPIWHTKKPDRDNLDKAVLDCLTELGYWRDDCQVCLGELAKRYAGAGGAPRAVVATWLWGAI